MTLVSVRSEEKSVFYGDTFEDGMNIREAEPDENPQNNEESEQSQTVRDKNFEVYKAMIEDMKS